MEVVLTVLIGLSCSELVSDVLHCLGLVRLEFVSIDVHHINYSFIFIFPLGVFSFPLSDYIIYRYRYIVNRFL